MNGLITETHRKENILNQFLKKLVKDNYTFENPTSGNKELIWCHFKKENECKVYSTEELFKSQLKIDNPVYFYDEFTEELFLTDFEDVRRFINGLEAWDDVDAEIFDDTFNWVIAVTHEDISKVLGLSIAIDEYDYEKDMMQ